ncbi:MAG: polymer-forming cytoskeletal protein [Sulfurospirillaceae bacterium]|nr:polymer-forming cytoskeletal protein [Sulfurospirillaceae bacterium]
MEDTIVSKETELKGTIKCGKNLVVFGDVEGRIEAKESVKIEAKSKVVGEVFAKILYVKGVFDGDADCDTVHILEGGSFTGNIKSRILVIDSKCYFSGKNEVKSDKKLDTYTSENKQFDNFKDDKIAF